MESKGEDSQAERIKENIDLLSTVHELKERNPQLFSAFRLPEEKLADEIEAGITKLFNEFDKIYVNSYLDATRQAFQPYIGILELAAAALMNLVFASDARANRHDAPVFWPKLEQDGYEPKPSAAFFAITTVLSNNLIAIRNLVVAGLDSQAKTLARSHLELMATCIAISVDDALFQDYIGGSEEAVIQAEAWMEKTKEHWRRVDGKVKKTLNTYFKKEFPESHEGFIDSIIWRFSNLSQYVHAQYLAIAQSTHYRRIQKEMEDEVEYSFGGLPCHESKDTLLQVCQDTWLYIFVIKGLLQKMHGWNDLGKDGSETLVALCFMDAYIITFARHVPAMQKEVQKLFNLQRAAARTND